MNRISPHINFNGNAEEAFMFYRSVFGGEFGKIIRFKDLAGPEFEVAESEENKIMLIELPIGENTLRANDVPEHLGRVSESENRSKISVAAASKEEAERIFNGLSVGGEIEMAMSEGPWGAYLGGFRDKYGIEWLIESDSSERSDIIPIF